MPQPTQTTTVRSIRDVAPDVREITLAPPTPPLDYLPGQWIGLHLPVGENQPLVRAYSLAAPPSPTGELVLCLDRVPGGQGSEYLFTVEPGDEITFAGPLGNFVLPDTRQEQLWLARYTGIVPFRAMLLNLLAYPPADPVRLVYSAARPEDLAYLLEFQQAAAEAEWLTVTPLLDQPAPGWEGRTGQVLDLLPEWVDDRLDLTPMVCGKRDFVRPIRDYFYTLGYDRKAVKWENYD